MMQKTNYKLQRLSYIKADTNEFRLFENSSPVTLLIKLDTNWNIGNGFLPEPVF
jgi:hypothetical protein